jgi:hypothetical protein
MNEHTRNSKTPHRPKLNASCEDLGIDLYIQIREVERCLDRYPERLSIAVKDLLVLVRRYNPELVWSYRRYDTPAQRMGESVRF